MPTVMGGPRHASYLLVSLILVSAAGCGGEPTSAADDAQPSCLADVCSYTFGFERDEDGWLAGGTGAVVRAQEPTFEGAASLSLTLTSGVAWTERVFRVRPGASYQATFEAAICCLDYSPSTVTPVSLVIGADSMGLTPFRVQFLDRASADLSEEARGGRLWRIKRHVLQAYPSSEGLLSLGYGVSHRLETGPLGRYYLDSLRVILTRD